MSFRTRYIDFATLTETLQAWALAHPNFVQLSSFGTSGQGRPFHLLTIGPKPEDRRPAVWVDGNMHATEVCGTSVSLGIAEDFIRLHRDGTIGLPEHVEALLKNVLVYVAPRLSPDGAEAVLSTGIYKRSVARDTRARTEPFWQLSDVDGDGNVRYMRKVDPTGELVSHPDAPDVLVPRCSEDVGPFYKLYPEGTIANFDGNIPNPHFLSDNSPDINRNFPFQWRSEASQVGAGNYPASEPESRAVLDFAIAHPNIFVWLNLHTFGGCFIRPSGDRADEKMQPFDLAVYKEVGAWAESITKYPMVSGFHEFLYEPSTPIYGAMAEWAYEERGALASVCELWDLFAELGLTRPAKFVDFYSMMERDQMLMFKHWDRDKNQGRVFTPWRAFMHPQLGAVEVGGIDRRVGLFNPPLDRIDEICRNMSTWFIKLAALVPRLTVEARVHPFADASVPGGVLEVTVCNVGYLPTHGMDQTREHPWNEAPILTLQMHDGAELIASPERIALPHLEGWGRGKGTFSAFHPDSKGSVSTWSRGFVVAGHGKVEVCVHAPRMGSIVVTAEC